MANPQSFRKAAAALSPLMAKRPLMRTVNFHLTPRSRAEEYERQIERFSKSFDPVDEDDLDRYTTTGRWHKSRPGLILAFFNGYRDNYDVAFPLLERYGFVGWFFVPTAFVDTKGASQQVFLGRTKLRAIPGEYADGRHALNWREIEHLHLCKHVIASHTRSHTRLLSEDAATLEEEIAGSQQDLQAHLGHRARTFASFSGSAFGEYPRADRLIRAAGYQFVFSNLKIQRVRDTWQPGER